MSIFISSTHATCRTGASCAATCCCWLDCKFHIFTVLSQPPEKTTDPSPDQAQSRTGWSWSMAAFATDWPLCCTSQHLTCVSVHRARVAVLGPSGWRSIDGKQIRLVPAPSCPTRLPQAGPPLARTLKTKSHLREAEEPQNYCWETKYTAREALRSAQLEAIAGRQLGAREHATHAPLPLLPIAACDLTNSSGQPNSPRTGANSAGLSFDLPRGEGGSVHTHMLIYPRRHAAARAHDVLLARRDLRRSRIQRRRMRSQGAAAPSAPGVAPPPLTRDARSSHGAGQERAGGWMGR
eukprot:scaffold3911_cov390-Prasinococcus_capsulatus_cf.AAC.1